MLPGTTQVDGLKLFIDHDDTKGIVVIGEIGGEAELNAAEFIKEYRSKTSNPKPIIAMVSGRTAPEGKTMGHAGALLSPRDASADKKAQELEVSPRAALNSGNVLTFLTRLREHWLFHTRGSLVLR